MNPPAQRYCLEIRALSDPCSLFTGDIVYFVLLLATVFWLQGSTIRKRKMYEEFLSKVSILGEFRSDVCFSNKFERLVLNCGRTGEIDGRRRAAATFMFLLRVDKRRSVAGRDQISALRRHCLNFCEMSNAF